MPPHNRMRVLWFTNTLMPGASRAFGCPAPKESGWWMSSLFDRLKRRDDLELAVVTLWSLGGGRTRHVTVDGTTHYIVPIAPAKSLLARFGLEAGWRPSTSQLREFAAIAREWQPDLLHIHGTELDYGLIKARGMVSTPTVVSLQGLMASCARKAWGELLPQEIDGPLRRVLLPRTQDERRWRWFRSRIGLEEEIVRSAEMVLGRTEFDRAWASAYHPGVRYRQVDEMVRPEFRDGAPWKLDTCRRYRVFCTSSGQPLKGIHLLLEAIYRLRQTCPEVKLVVAGSGFGPGSSHGYARFVWEMIRHWNLEPAIEFRGYMNGEGLARELAEAHCYVMPSYIENSSNALQEAMLSGIPCIASYTGGTPSILDSGRSGLLFPPGDAALLAHQIARVFEDDELARQFGEQARAIGLERQDPERIERQVLDAYMELAGSAGGRIHAKGGRAALPAMERVK